jgi:hypothetical protein
VKPLENHPYWEKPREFIFNDDTMPSEFVRGFPELSLEPAASWLSEALEYIRAGEFVAAIGKLQQLEELLEDLPVDMALQVLYDRACGESRRAEKLSSASEEYKNSLNDSINYLKRWYELGSRKGWVETGRTPQNEIFRMGCDSDLRCLLAARRNHILDIAPDFKQYMPNDLPKPSSGGGGGGCVLIGTKVETPQGLVPVEDLRVGSEILSVDMGERRSKIVTKVLSVHSSRETRCIKLNRRSIFTPSQPLYLNESVRIRAGDLRPGAEVIGADSLSQVIAEVQEIRGYFEVYCLSTGHKSHNFLACHLVCANWFYK